MLKKSKNKVLKSWDFVENGLYFENIEEKNQKSYFKCVKTAAVEKRCRLFARYRLLAPTGNYYQYLNIKVDALMVLYFDLKTSDYFHKKATLLYFQNSWSYVGWGVVTGHV